MLSVLARAGAPRSSRTQRRLSPDARALAVVVAAVVLVNLPYVVGIFDADPLGPRSGLASALTPGPLQPTIDPNNGFISQALTHRAVLDWLDLKWPWWNPYQATGAPLAGNMQSAALFPPSLLVLLPNGQLYERMLLEIVAGLSTFLLLRRLSVSRRAAVPAAIAFALNGTFAWFAHAAMNPVALLVTSIHFLGQTDLQRHDARAFGNVHLPLARPRPRQAQRQMSHARRAAC